jgi:hypothetical protein
MKSSLLTAVMIVLGSAGSSLAAASGCPASNPSDTAAQRVSQAHDYCEARWQTMVSTNTTGGRTHDAAVNACSRRCVGKAGEMMAGYDLNNIGGLAIPGLIAVAAGAATIGSYSPPPPSPASP